MELRTHITKEEPPNGASDQWIKAYNALQDRINSFIKDGRKVPEELLNGSFAMVNMLYELNHGLKNKSG